MKSVTYGEKQEMSPQFWMVNLMGRPVIDRGDNVIIVKKIMKT
jgi:hypothetical protein